MKGMGLNGVPICESSQNGELLVNPHAQYRYYFPGYNFMLYYGFNTSSDIF